MEPSSQELVNLTKGTLDEAVKAGTFTPNAKGDEVFLSPDKLGFTSHDGLFVSEPHADTFVVSLRWLLQRANLSCSKKEFI